jgi:hypothetical protein
MAKPVGDCVCGFNPKKPGSESLCDGRCNGPVNKHRAVWNAGDMVLLCNGSFAAEIDSPSDESLVDDQVTVICGGCLAEVDIKLVAEERS